MKVSMVQPLSIHMFSYLTNTTSAIRIPCGYSGLIITYINDKNNGEGMWILEVDNKFFCVREMNEKRRILKCVITMQIM